MFQDIKVTFLDNDGWKLPFNFAVILHAIVIFGSIYGPKMLNNKPIFPDIYTIDLISVSETQLETAKPAKTSSPPTELPDKDVNKPLKKAVPIADSTPQKEITPVETKPVSIKPLKRKKIVQHINKPPVQPKKDLEKIHKENLDEFKEAERLAQEAARLAASEAVRNLKQMLEETNTISKNNTPSTSQPATTNTRRTTSSAVESQYFAAVSNKLHSYWALPEYKVWDPDLVAIVVIQIEKNGQISKQFFEKKSNDKLFDQFVLKTLQDASPLPAIPAALKEETIEIGFRFRPGGIQF